MKRSRYTQMTPYYTLEMMVHLWGWLCWLWIALGITQVYILFVGNAFSFLFTLYRTHHRFIHNSRMSQFRCLGVEIHRDLGQFIPLNLNPVVSLLTQRCVIWKSLPLTPVGRINLIKMYILPKFTYLFRQTPIPILNAFFRRLDTILISFIWKGVTPRVAKSTLQLPITLGGLTLPCFIKYYWAAILVTVRRWLSEEPVNPASTLEAALLDSYSELWNLVHRGPRSNPNMTPSMRTTLLVWDTVRLKVEKPSSWCPHMG